MSCWVVPAVAAEYWGVSLDTVWGRIYDEQVPHKLERGFVFVDLDPWRAQPTGGVRHPPPPTFVAIDDSSDSTPASEISDTLIELDSCEVLCLCDQEGSPDSDEADEPARDETQLPELDEEESATFGRLSWREVREQVSRTRRPPFARCQ